MSSIFSRLDRLRRRLDLSVAKLEHVSAWLPFLLAIALVSWTYIALVLLSRFFK